MKLSGSSACETSTSDAAEIVEAMRTMYAAATADDLVRFHSVAAAEFYAFDGGKRFDGDALMHLIKLLHAAGKIYVWNITEPEVHVTCDLGWITYINRGSLQDASGTENLSWLESAVLRKEAGRWRILFLHTTRMS